MRHSVSSRLVVALAPACLLLGCASGQLNYNTLDIANSVESLYTRQALDNLSKYIDGPNAIPSQMDVLQGTVQTSASVTPSFTFPLSQSITNTGTRTGAALTSTNTGVLAGAAATLGGSDTWQQNWNIVPLSDANTLRNLRALYRYVVYPDVSLLKSEYTVARMAEGKKFVDDPYAISEPQCVLCTPKHKVNPRLRAGWLYWTPGRPPPPDTSIVDLGIHGRHQLFMTAQDYFNGYLSDFVLFLMPVAPLTAAGTPPKPGTVTPGGRAATTPGRGPYINRPPIQPGPQYNIPGILPP
jgi:hypothetical protein